MKRRALEILTNKITSDKYFFAVCPDWILIGRYDNEPCIVSRKTIDKLAELIADGVVIVRDGVIVLTRGIIGIEPSYLSILCSPEKRIAKKVTSSFIPEKYNCSIF